MKDELLAGQMVLIDHDDGLYSVREVTDVYEIDGITYYEVEGENYPLPYFDVELFDKKNFDSELYGGRL